jgi:hypothetical protein
MVDNSIAGCCYMGYDNNIKPRKRYIHVMDVQLTQEPDIDRCYAYREFSYGSGFINLYLLENNRIEVYIVDMFDYDLTQSIMLIEYHESVSIYDLINIVFDKITEDLQICLRGLTYTTIISCSEWLIQNHPEVCNFDTKKTDYAAEWMEVTHENCQYIKPQKPHLTCNRNPNDIILYGTVDASGTFIYDYPIVGYDENPEYYKVSRGHHWSKVEYDEVNKRYFIAS